ncbi:MAG: sensor histidine kinase, partial [Acidovorax sp.]|nr:sensor histidine kinase [Acidovorax sp.]
MIPTPTDLEAPKRPVRVLHLEDSTADHALVRLTLRRAGLSHEIHQVDSLEAFTGWLERESFDVILADYRLPGFTALDAWRIVEQCPGHP